MNVIKTALLSFCILYLTACASMANDAEQSIKIDTWDSAGKPIAGAECEARNEYGTYHVLSGERVLIHRSGEDLKITCHKADYLPATSTVVSSMNGSVAANVLGLGWIGVAMDRSSGKAWSYPENIELTFGQSKTLEE